jgi:hypothetical protein
MRARNVMLTLILLAGIFLFALWQRWREPLPREAFHRMPARLRFYAFAKCRMQCIDVLEVDVKMLMQTGVININKSNRRLQPCPLFAVQGRVRGKSLRVLFEQCRNGTFVVNCYNLESETACDCSTEYQPKQN